METIGERLAAYREARGWSQTQLADRAVMSQSTIARIETGNSPGSRYTLRRLAAALGIKLVQLQPPVAPGKRRARAS